MIKTVSKLIFGLLFTLLIVSFISSYTFLGGIYDDILESDLWGYLAELMPIPNTIFNMMFGYTTLIMILSILFIIAFSIKILEALIGRK